MMKHLKREDELAYEIENLKQQIDEKQDELDVLKERLSIAENKRGQIMRYIAGEVKKMMNESK